ncbi:ParB/RepB/Spo0J family partition protein [Streptomyces sp. NPDC047737]|uniref:ParB/RepB/Spo0J family partition protein n=1 Tax=Streptomyces sp. NPDC047737 TaxID=3155740 RepID=UPI0033DD5CB0
MAGRRTSLASLAGSKVDTVPGSSDPLLLTLPLSVLVPTRFNPRRNFGDEEALKAFGLVLKRRQLQPAVVVSRSAYLKLWPDEEEAVGSAQYVIANGERRFRGSLAAGLTTLAVVHNEPVANSRADFLDAVLSENNDREDLDPIERALGIQTMTEQLGGKGKVAEHYKKSAGWVTQQMYLLQLAPELQALVSNGTLPVRETRSLVKLSHDEQLRAWRQREEQREAEKERPRTVRPVVEQAPVFTAVKNAPPADGTHGRLPAGRDEPAAVEAATFTAVKPSPASTEPKPEPRGEGQSAQAALPEPRQGPGAAPQEDAAEQADEPPGTTWQLPPGGWEVAYNALRAQMSEYDRHMLTRKLIKLMDMELGRSR